MIAFGSSVSETVNSTMEKLGRKRSRSCRNLKVADETSLQRQQASTRKVQSQIQSDCSSACKVERSSIPWFRKYRSKSLTTRKYTECQVTGMPTIRGAKIQIADKLFKGFRRGKKEIPQEKKQMFHGGRSKTRHSNSFSGHLGKDINNNSGDSTIADDSKIFTSKEEHQMTTDYKPNSIRRSSSFDALSNHKFNKRKSERAVESVTRDIDHLCKDTEDYRPEIDQLAPPRRSRSRTFGGKASEKVVVVLEGRVYQTDDAELDCFLTTTLCSTEL